VPFTALYPDFEEYFEEVRSLVEKGQDKKGGEKDEREDKGDNGSNGNGHRGEKGRQLPKFEKSWRAGFDAAHLKRIAMWTEMNREAEEQLALEREEVENGDGDSEAVNGNGER
jgi:hypothetical protein